MSHFAILAVFTGVKLISVRVHKSLRVEGQRGRNILRKFYLSLTWLISKLSRGEVKLCGAGFFGSSNLTSNLVDILWYFFSFFLRFVKNLFNWSNINHSTILSRDEWIMVAVVIH